MRSKHSAEIPLRKEDPGHTSSEISPKARSHKPEIYGTGPLVLFGASTVAPRIGIKTLGEGLKEYFSERGWSVDVHNTGVPGDSTKLGRERLDRDVLSHNPSLGVILFSTNDAAVDVWKDPPASEPRVALSDYRANLEFFVDTIRDRGAEVVLMAPQPLRWTPLLRKLYGKSPYHPEDDHGLNVVLKSYVKAVRGIAEEKKVPLIDIYAAFNDFPRTSGCSVDSLLADGMHPNDEGHILIRDLLISALDGNEK